MSGVVFSCCSITSWGWEGDQRVWRARVDRVFREFVAPSDLDWHDIHLRAIRALGSDHPGPAVPDWWFDQEGEG